ncbi:MAG: potassium/hydrogen antiporter [Solirubrobacteraceae bacterium]|jgi:cell volume regulation protein A|nr:potassium/hydrogen antiporter [Solirubrobacteraceae bacterium]
MSVPTPFLLLIAAALVPGGLSLDVAEPVAGAALVVVLLDGGMGVDLRGSLRAVLWLGVAGTFITAAVAAVAAHALLGYGWTAAGLLGAALAPTDPAMVFATLRGRQLRGRFRTLLEGEAGLNDPAGIALMLGLIELATHDDKTFAVVVVEFARQMGLGAVLGLAGGRVLRRVSHPVALLALAAALYGVTALIGGSGFLAVFVAAIHLPRRAVGGSVAEAAVFVTLGLTVHVGGLPWVDGLVLALAIALVARPVAVALTRLRPAESPFVAFAGLKGAVPILLAAFAVTGGVAGANGLYGVVFVAVAVNVLVIGTLLPTVASRLGVAEATQEPLRSEGRKRSP